MAWQRQEDAYPDACSLLSAPLRVRPSPAAGEPGAQALFPRFVMVLKA
jgi:hypothetical protein